MADKKHNKSRMEGIGEFFGHIIKGVKTKPEDTNSSTHEVKRTVEEERTEDGVILRRTTIDEVEIPKDQLRPAPRDDDSA